VNSKADILQGYAILLALHVNSKPTLSSVTPNMSAQQFLRSDCNRGIARNDSDDKISASGCLARHKNNIYRLQNDNWQISFVSSPQGDYYSPTMLKCSSKLRTLMNSM
jgi:hypothetical protein